MIPSLEKLEDTARSNAQRHASARVVSGTDELRVVYSPFTGGFGYLIGLAPVPRPTAVLWLRKAMNPVEIQG